MPITFDCPHCYARVEVADEHAGSQGQCPQCEGLFQIPLTTPITSDAARTEPHRGDLPEWSRRVDPAWSTVRKGLSLVHAGIMTYFIAVVITAAVVAFLVAIGGDKLEFGGLALVFLVLGLLAILAGAVMMFIGTCFCGSAPDPGVRGLAIASLICAIVYILTGIVAGVMKVVERAPQARQAEARDIRPPEAREKGDAREGREAGERDRINPVTTLLQLASSGASLVAILLFLLALRGIGQHFHNSTLVRSVHRYLIFWGSSIAGAFLLGCLIGFFSVAAKGEGAVIGVIFLLVVVLVVFVALFLWFLDLLRRARTTIAQAQGLLE